MTSGRRIASFVALIFVPIVALGCVSKGKYGDLEKERNALVEERNEDTAPWVLSKPVSRSAYVVAKTLGTWAGIVAIGVVLAAVGSSPATDVDSSSVAAAVRLSGPAEVMAPLQTSPRCIMVHKRKRCV